MGRIQYNWNREIESRGHTLQCIEPKELGKLKHPLFFPIKAKAFLRNSSISPDAIISHEPASGVFVNKAPVFLVSHGIEARYWELSLKGKIPNQNAGNFKTRLLFPLWRLSVCNKGLRKAHKLLLSNEEDANYAQLKFNRKASDIMIFKNGYYFESVPAQKSMMAEPPVILWNASWLDRKGKTVLVGALDLLYKKGILFHCTIAGTGYPEDEVLSEIPADLHPFITVISKFQSSEEMQLLANSSIFVLPSYFEGLPLSLIQAMASGLCCVVSDNCGQRDVIKHNLSGLLFETGNPEKLGIELERVIKDIELRNRLAENSKNEVKDWNWKSVSKEVIDFIERSL